MDKSDVSTWLQAQYREWAALVDQVEPTQMDQPGANGDWSMKDLVAHLTGWNRWLVIQLQAALRGEPEPLPPWPAHLQDGDDINAWIYESNRGRSAREILDETDQTQQQLVAVIENLPESLPEPVRFELIEPAYHLLWVGDKRFNVGEFFDHFRDDHAATVRAWLTQEEKH